MSWLLVNAAAGSLFVGVLGYIIGGWRGFVAIVVGYVISASINERK